jgi:hypothetical protein
MDCILDTKDKIVNKTVSSCPRLKKHSDGRIQKKEAKNKEA